MKQSTDDGLRPAANRSSKAQPRLTSDRPVIDDALVVFGENVRLARIARNVSQAQLANRAGVSASLIKRLEGGRPGISLDRLVAVLWAMDMLEPLLSAISPANDPCTSRLLIAQLPRRASKTGGKGQGAWGRAGLDPSKL